ncbi:MAG: tRNA (adenosine(37)-N6)-threonylcarbamoyltransferase complex dimerization subunit type 1 TsaB [Actinomycetota bacterium]
MGRPVIVVGIDTSTPQVSVAIGTEAAILGRIQITGTARQESVTPALQRLLAWTGVELDHVGGFVVGTGPGLFTGLRVGIETAKTLAQVTKAPIIGIPSIDALAYAVRHAARTIAAVIDGRRKEVFSALYQPVPGGVMRLTELAVQRPEALAAELEAHSGEVLAVGDGAILYRDVLQTVGARVEFGSPGVAHPDAAALVELAVPRFLREEHDQLFDVVPMYLRKSDAEIAWDDRARGGKP